jgi:hypothetical protein
MRVHAIHLKVTGPSMAWLNGNDESGRPVAVLFKGAQTLAALRNDAEGSTAAQLVIEMTGVERPCQPSKSNRARSADAAWAVATTFNAHEYLGRVQPEIAASSHWHSIVDRIGRRSFEVRWLEIDQDGEEKADPKHHEAKGERHSLFASWLVDVFGAELLRAGAGVVDVAGGSGELSMEVHALTAAPCTVIDPLEQYAARLSPRLSWGGLGRHLRQPFDAECEEQRALLTHCSLLAAMHPDQATEAMVDAALRLGKPFAVVPCCVFPSLFKARRRLNGDGVVRYACSPGRRKSRPLTAMALRWPTHGALQSWLAPRGATLASPKPCPQRFPCLFFSRRSLLDYLQDKDVRIERASLPFVGRNVVLFMRPPSTPQKGEAEGGLLCVACTGS